ncbi:hypothetical protein MWU65_09245 [Cellulophaga sp. F20128]|uniref:hypothetical protein n=1 Tax=Cellulophaga sp. F20128 TaxID=2926413 RepID=UPI001FF51ECF|nr:hypothetical protein [Cellulophaga sp. F20128]MCK0157361.1 hypothetical protein [Cellulophaga sp. F20128]
MKKKLYYIAIAFLSVMGVSNAQEGTAAAVDDTECRNNLSIYNEHVKVKNFDAAYEPWKMVYETCPDYHFANYVYGEYILKHKLKSATGAERTALVNTLLGLYDNWGKYFPTKHSTKADRLIDKAMLKSSEDMSTTEELYNDLNTAFREDGKNFKNTGALFLYFKSLVDLHKEGKQELQTVFDLYDDLSQKIEEINKEVTDRIAKLLVKEDAGTITKAEKSQLDADTQNSEKYGIVANNMDVKLGSLADCENLIPLYEKNFDAKQDDLEWVKRAVSRMFNKECLDSEMFKKLFQRQLAMEPSANAYVYSAALKLKEGDKSGALQDFTKASELETDPYKKSKILYKIAASYSRINKATSYKYAQQSLNFDPSNGNAYLLMASAVGSSANECGSTKFEKLAINWKAAELARKAGRVDPSLSYKASATAKAYNDRAPSRTDIFSNNMQGKTVKFNCWVGGSVKVPNL